MSSITERSMMIAKYKDAIGVFDRFFGPGADKDLLDYRPDIEDAWTVREHLIHAADADMHSYVRIRMAIAQPGTKVMVWDEEAWFARLSYERQDLDKSMALMRGVREVIAAELSKLDESLWSQAWVDHPERGRMDLDALLVHFTKHAEIHHDYIKRNEERWRATSGA